MNDFISEGKRKRKRDSEEKDIQTKKTKCASLFIIGCFGVWSFLPSLSVFSQYSCVSHYRFFACTFTLYSATYRKVFVFVEKLYALVFLVAKVRKRSIIRTKPLIRKANHFWGSDIFLLVLCIILTRGTARWSIILLSCDKTNMYRCDLIGYFIGRFGLTHARVGKDKKKERK